ncbi:phenylacetate-CoA ligase [Nocardia mexicana]|uniref:Phenylacetate-CoA ligase n=2 Tax=Nocardia mexicana TaxID=279262 RepID=A0A370GK70_9NOCA|nr:phenylacetate-CoA ligase [Nocardia mexicana]
MLLSFRPVCKTDIRDDFLDHCNDDVTLSECRLITTSGTSGQPFKFIRTREQMVDGHALGWIRDIRWGIPFGGRVIRPSQDWLTDWFEHTVPAERLTRVVQFGEVADAQRRAELARRSRDFAPQVVAGHPSYLRRFVRLLAENGESIDDVEAILTFGETLEPGVRQDLESALNAPLYDSYGLKEFGTVAAQHPACGMYHMTDESLYVEILDTSGSRVPDGEIGEITITDFTNTAMPFVRYRTGDTGALRRTPCTCGDPHMVLDLIEGRATDEFVLPDGVRVAVGPLTRLTRNYPVRSFQFVADEGGQLALNIEPLPAFVAEQATDLAACLSNLLPGAVSLKLSLVDRSEFAVSPSGKMVDFLDRTSIDSVAGRTLPSEKGRR